MKRRVGLSLANISVRSKGQNTQSHTRLFGTIKHVTHGPPQTSRLRPRREIRLSREDQSRDFVKWNEYSSHPWKAYKVFEMAGAQTLSALIT